MRLVKKFALCLMMLLLQSTVINGQVQKFDSLKKLLPREANPTKRIDLLLDIARSIYYTIPDSSIGYCEQASGLSINNNLETQLAQSLHCESRYLVLKGEIRPAIEKLNKAINLFQKHHEQKGLAKAYSLKAIALGKLDKLQEELDYLLKSKQINISIKDNPALANSLLNITHCYIELKNYQAALNTLQEYEQLNLPEGENDFFVQNHYGRIYENLGDFNKSKIHYKKSIQKAHQYNMLDSEITGLTNLADSYRKQGNNAEAKSYFFQALDLAQQSGLVLEELDVLKGITAIYELEKDYGNAFLSLKKTKAIHDSIFNIEKVKSINEIENKLQLSEKEKIITQQKLSLAQEKVALASSKNKTLLLIAGLAIACLALFFLFYYNAKTKKLYSLIKVQKNEVELQKEIIEMKNKDVMDSIHYAKYIQGSMLPSDKTMRNLFSDHFVLYKPKDVVAGDFYWTETVNNMQLLAVCDCTGHGVPGAMVSIVACNALNRAVKEFNLSDPAKIFDKVNELMQETFSKSDYELNDGMDGVLCLFDYSNKKLHLAAANNPVWVISPPSIKTELWEEPWQLSQVSADKKPIGKFKDDVTPFQTKTLNLEKGEMLYLFSDGYADQFGGPKGKKFKYKQLQELLISAAPKNTEKQRELLDKTIENWKGNLDQVDDILVVGIRV